MTENNNSSVTTPSEIPEIKSDISKPTVQNNNNNNNNSNNNNNNIINNINNNNNNDNKSSNINNKIDDLGKQFFFTDCFHCCKK